SAGFNPPSPPLAKDLLIPSPPYPGERARVRGSFSLPVKTRIARADSSHSTRAPTMPNASPAIPAEVPVKLPYASSLVGARPMLWHSGVTLPKFFSLHLMGALFPVIAGFMLYGWRALLLIATVMASASLALILWRRIAGRGGQLRLSHVLYLSLLLSLMLPVHLMTTDRPFEESFSSQWAIAAGAGILLVMLTWLL